MPIGGPLASGLRRDEVSVTRETRSIAVLVTATVLASLAVGVPNVALPVLADGFGAGLHTVEWVILVYLLASMVLGVGVGRWGDVVGHRRVFLGGLAVSTVAAALCAFAPSLWALIALRAVHGAGGVMVTATTIALVRELVPVRRTGTAMGLLGTATATGSALGPAIGGVAIAAAGWRFAFGILAVLGVGVLALAWLTLPRAAHALPAGRPRFDWTGSALIGVSVGAYALAVTAGAGLVTVVAAAVALAGTALFWRSQTRSAHPLIEPAALRDGVLRRALILNVLVPTVMMGFFVLSPFYLSGALGLTDVALGAVMSVSPIISAVSGIVAGRTVDRLGATPMVTAGVAAMLIGSIALALAPGWFGLAGFLVPLLVFTPGYQLFLAANNTAVMARADDSRRGVTSGMISLSRGFGFVTGTAAMGALFASAPDAASGMRLMMSVSAGLMLLGVTLSLRHRGDRPN